MSNGLAPSPVSGPVLSKTDLASSRGVYANVVNAIVAQEEVVLDFILSVGPEASLVSRVVLSPAHAKRLGELLSRQGVDHSAPILVPQGWNRPPGSA